MLSGLRAVSGMCGRPDIDARCGGVRQTCAVDSREIEQFERDGYLAVRGAVDPDVAAACREAIWTALAWQGVSRDRATWTRPVVRVRCPEGGPFEAAGTAPALWSAYDALIGPGRWARRRGVGGSVPVRFPSEEYPGDVGWHIEGSYEVNGEYWANVRSRARGLLALFLFSDVGEDDAPTRMAIGSHLAMPSILKPAGETGMSDEESISRVRPSVMCRTVVHATGRAGDVFLCHPFIVHTATWPHRDMAAPRHDAADDGPAWHLRRRRLRDRRIRSVASRAGDLRRPRYRWHVSDEPRVVEQAPEQRSSLL